MPAYIPTFPQLTSSCKTMLFPPVAIGPIVTGVRMGLVNCQEVLEPLSQRLPLPASVAVERLELVVVLLLILDLDLLDKNLLLLRVAVATITSYTSSTTENVVHVPFVVTS